MATASHAPAQAPASREPNGPSPSQEANSPFAANFRPRLGTTMASPGPKPRHSPATPQAPELRSRSTTAERVRVIDVCRR
eukprot:6409070-Prymnesium_polylepis.1